MTTEKPLIDKAVACMTHGGRPLGFGHAGQPGAGIQVPAGAIEPGETPELAAGMGAMLDLSVSNTP